MTDTVQGEPDRDCLTVYYGHHKCATNWIRPVLEQLFESMGLSSAYFHNWHVFSPELRPYADKFFSDWAEQVIGKGVRLLSVTDASWSFRSKIDRLFPDNRAVHVIRDPRDLVVSALYSHRYSHSIESFPQLAEHRRRLLEVSDDDALYEVMDFVAPVLDDIESWYPSSNVLELRMEEVLHDDVAAFMKILEHFGLWEENLRNSVIEIATNNRFEAKSGGRKQGVEDRTSHFRKGMSGDWKNHLSSKHLHYLNERHGGLVKRFE